MSPLGKGDDKTGLLFKYFENKMNKKQEKTKMVPNRFGIMVKKCCASCQHKCLNDYAQRNCELTKRKVMALQVCDDWQMSEQLDMLGNARGRVQRREYQLTLIEVRASEVLAMRRGLTIASKSLEDIQKEFELEHGSRFSF
jgi:hypothetical protein